MNSAPIIKVCGLCRDEDVDVALDAGANALGFVHHPPSARHMDIAPLVDLVQRATDRGQVNTVLVLVDAAPDQACAWAERLGVSHLQLCGREDPQAWKDVGRSVRILRRVSVQSSAPAEVEAWASLSEAFVLDHPAGPGGTGAAVDPSLARRLSALGPCILAGGLDGDNVTAQVAAVAPMGVDASSRLESEPGIKDPQRLRAFVHAARRALGQGDET